MIKLPSFLGRKRKSGACTCSARANCLDSVQNRFEFRPKGTAKVKTLRRLTPVGATGIIEVMRTTQRKGDIAVSQAVARFTKMGYDVSLPLTESAAYDIVIDIGKDLKRVQVRYSSTKDVELRRVHSNSKGYVVKKAKANVYDWLYVLKSTGEEYLIKECLSNRSTIRPTLEHLLAEGSNLSPSAVKQKA